MPVLNPQKVVDKNSIPCGGTARVTLSFEASPLLKNDPANIVLIMDKSGSMNGGRMDFAKAAAKRLVNMVTTASGGVADVSFAGGTTMSLVSFDTSAKVNIGTTADAASVNAEIDKLKSGGSTNHEDAFLKAEGLIDPSSPVRQIVIMFTDGNTNVGNDPKVIADRIKGYGAEIYCIGLVPDPATLNSWANTPSEKYVAYTDDVTKLQQVFENIAYEVILAGAHDVEIVETLSSDFKVTNVDAPSHGTAVVRSPGEIIWQADGVGAFDNEKISLSFDVVHIGNAGGDIKVNKSVSYTDREGNALSFPEPSVNVDCTAVVIRPESCPLPTAFPVFACKDSAVADVPSVHLESLGRIVRVDATLKSICPGRKVAAAIFLTETDENGIEHQRGMKTVSVPAQTGTACQDITLKCIHFVVPENEDSICKVRGFNVRVLANYVDTDFTCCDDTVVTI